uniref:RdRp n=1 Tax=Erysiphe necator associated ssRNA virus 1 TaxID=2695359 RepID=A0A7S5I0E0_9VIRU|nr:RdRp [Erysiphe necator associated ssRNA virus 1]
MSITETKFQAAERMKLRALQDKTSPYYKGLAEYCRRVDAEEKREKTMRSIVTIPFQLSESQVEDLEQYFSVSLRCKGNVPRGQYTVYVSALNFCLEAALAEHAGGGGKYLLCLDGDLMTTVAEGGGSRLVERTYATGRLGAGYFLEDEAVRSRALAKADKLRAMAEVVERELRSGGGEHYWPRVREDGPEVDAILVNHFKTPAGPHQLANLARLRGGAAVLGAIPFQVSFLFETKGRLECFPGWFYVDKEADVITLVPDDDATMSISHPYSCLVDVCMLNTVTVEGVEFLCEKYKTLRGILYYSLRRIGTEFDVPELLRTCYYDTTALDRCEISFPRVKFTSERVPIGWERGKVTMQTSRYEKVMHRMVSSTSGIVTPAEVYSVLVDYNNTVVNTLDTATLAQRMGIAELEDAALAIALQVNWRRSEARGTFNAISSAIGKRREASEATLFGIARVAMVTWWSKPRIADEIVNEELPVQQVVDWLGNDFGVFVKDVDPWVEVVQVAGVGDGELGRCFSWLPIPKYASVKSPWYQDLLARATSALRPSVETSKKSSSVGVFRGAFTPRLAVKPLMSQAPVVMSQAVVERPSVSLTTVKKMLKDKLVREQGAVNERVPASIREIFVNNYVGRTLWTPVPDVNIVSAITGDYLMLVKRMPDRDVAATGYRLAEVDIYKYAEAEMRVNDAKRNIPKERWIRRPMVDLGVEGNRVQSQAALMGAAFKRNIGVPANRGMVNLDALPVLAVEKMIEVCFVEGWEDILNKHLENGMWEPNETDITEFVSDLDESKVEKMLKEFFLEGLTDLTEWKLMAKGKIKPSREAEADKKIDHSQTIMFQENSSVNAMYSSITRRVKRCFDECLRPEISMNAQESDEAHEQWYNSLNDLRKAYTKTYCYSADIRCYDRSQEHVALRCYLTLCKKLGLDEERLARWEQAYGAKRAACGFFGLILSIVLSGISGSWDTLFRNGCVNLISTVYSADLERGDIVMMDIKGDDIDAEFSKPLNVTTTVEKLSNVMNLSAKFFTVDVRYMCKQFRLKVGDWWYFVSDPWVKTQGVCTPITIDSQDQKMAERWQSLVADLRHYDNGLLVDAVAEAAQQHYASEMPLYGMARALSKMRGSTAAFHAFYKSPEKLW